MINKSVGAVKREKTANDNKQRKIVERNAAIRMKFENGEQKFQLERARRLAELFPPTNVIQQIDEDLPDLPEETADEIIED